MKCREAVEMMFRAIGKDAACCFTNGFISRIAYITKDRPMNLYMVGSMGLVSSVGLGIAMNSKRRVVVFDGDGSALMNLGALPLIGNQRPRNLLHVILDNGCYASTGGQATVSDTTDFCGLAKASGYGAVFSACSALELARKLPSALRARGPALLHIRIEAETAAPPVRVAVTPQQMAVRIKKHISGRR